MKLYGKRDPIKQGKWYIKHIIAMTSEGLYEKADIAMELAYRDIEIDRLEELVSELTSEIKNGG